MGLLYNVMDRFYERYVHHRATEITEGMFFYTSREKDGLYKRPQSLCDSKHTRHKVRERRRLAVFKQSSSPDCLKEKTPPCTPWLCGEKKKYLW